METLCKKISSHLKTDLEQRMFTAALRSLAQTDNPLRANNFAYALRELGRHVLRRLSPDNSVRRCSWYESDPNKCAQDKPTRAHRIVFAVQGGLADEFVLQTLKLNVPQMRKRFLDVVDGLNKFTHIEASVFDVDDAAAGVLAHEALGGLALLFDTIDECHAQVAESVAQQINEDLLSHLLVETLSELDELATHHLVTDVQVEDVEVKSIDDKTIVFSTTGVVDCRLQYGSDADVRRDDGAICHDSFPVTCDFRADVESPLDVSLERRTLEVDTSSFFGE